MRGVRFAPSPTGRFHLGNLRTAWISWKWARALDEPWVVRFEDIDAPRVLKGAQEGQLADLAALGLVPDAVLVQSQFGGRHWEVFERAVREGQVYPCVCSRREVQEALAGLASAPHGEVPVYSGRCRAGGVASSLNPTVAWRFRSADPSGAGDFIVARTDRLEPDRQSFVPAYHWACAMDDFDGEYSLLVRAWDLESATSVQRAVGEWLGARSAPAVFHTSLVTANDGSRLEKRTRGVTLPELLAVGWSPEKILSRFQVELHGFAPGRVWGEARRQLTLSEWGL